MRQAILLVLFLCGLVETAHAQGAALRLNDREYFSARGLDVLVFNNWYSGLFSDSKLSGVEIIHHGDRTATNGDVRLSNTPEQWDPIPQFVGREVDQATGRVEASLRYPDFNFDYRIAAEPHADGILLSVHLDAPVPEALAGRAGFNLEFLPTAYFGKAFLADGRPGLFSRHPTGPMVRAPTGAFEAAPLDSGAVLILAPGDPERRVTIDGRGATVALYDGRNKAQNGWFVARSLLPAGQTGKVVEWLVTPNRIPTWTRRPVIAHSQAGYHPDQPKVAVLELDPTFDAPTTVTLFQIAPDGRLVARMSGEAELWGRYLRYDYARFDFSEVTEPGLYHIAFAGVQSEPFPIAEDVYTERFWQSTLDTFMPVQMDHMFVNDRYRVWHGASHLDDALQAPVDHVHFDLYAQGPTTDTPYQPGQHIPGLDVGGWYDAGDFDIRTQSQYGTVTTLVLAYETFGLDWDETMVEQANRYVELRRPDGVPDALQQIEHGTLALLAQYRAVGHAIPGIVEAHIHQYTHLGDGLTKTDNLIYDPSLDSLEVQGNRSGTFDDRWAFTSKSSALDYGAAAALGAAARVLRGYNDALADEALQTALRVWNEEQSREPIIFRHGNTTGGPLEAEMLEATVELLITTEGAQQYIVHLREMWPYVERTFAFNGSLAVRALPYMDEAFGQQVEAAARDHAAGLDSLMLQNPFGVPITTGGWGGSGSVLRFAMDNYILHQAFPKIVGPEHTFRGLEYVLGRHPGNSLSMVSGIGARSKTIAYGTNRADYSFIPGGIVPGLVIVQPDLPELMEDWPFLWYESEYVIPMAPLFIYVANAAADLLKGSQ